VPQDADKEISITFPSRHWTVILASIDSTCQISFRALEDARNKGKKPEDMSEGEITALVGPMLIRGRIIDELAKQGIVTKDAADDMGYASIMKRVGIKPEEK